MRKIIFIFILIFVIMVITPSPTSAKTMWDFLSDRMVQMNDIQVRWDQDLTHPRDLATMEQLHNRLNSIIVHAQELNYIYPDAYWRNVALDIYGIIEHETGFVNYRSLDAGLSFGVGSMKWSTAYETMGYLGEHYSDTSLRDNTDVQIRLTTAYYYRKLLKYKGDSHAAIISYNRGYNVDTSIQRHERYFFSVYGRVEYIKRMILTK